MTPLPIPGDFRPLRQFHSRAEEARFCTTADQTAKLLLEALDVYLRANPIGHAFGPESVYWLDVPCGNRTGWRPSASIVASGRLAGNRFPSHGLHGRPALAFVSVAPGDKANDLERALLDYVAAGVPLIWVAYPTLRIGRVVRPGEPFVIAEDGGAFDGGDVLPGLRVSLADLLPPADPMPDRSGSGE